MTNYVCTGTAIHGSDIHMNGKRTRETMEEQDCCVLSKDEPVEEDGTKKQRISADCKICTTSHQNEQWVRISPCAHVVHAVCLLQQMENDRMRGKTSHFCPVCASWIVGCQFALA